MNVLLMASLFSTICQPASRRGFNCAARSASLSLTAAWNREGKGGSLLSWDSLNSKDVASYATAPEHGLRLVRYMPLSLPSATRANSLFVQWKQRGYSNSQHAVDVGFIHIMLNGKLMEYLINQNIW